MSLKNSSITISFGHLKSHIEPLLRTLDVVKDNEEIVEMKIAGFDLEENTVEIEFISKQEVEVTRIDEHV